MDEIEKTYRRFYPWMVDGLRDCSWESPGDADGIPVSSDLDAQGRELPDATPMAPPVGYRNGPSLSEFVHRMIHNEISRAAADAEFETFEEADDLDIPDDPLDPLTPYEEVFMPKMPVSAGPGTTPLPSADGGSKSPVQSEGGGGSASSPGDKQTGPVGSPGAPAATSADVDPSRKAT